MARRRVFKTEIACRRIDLSTKRRLSPGQTVGLRKSTSGCEVDVMLDDTTVGSLEGAVGVQVASAIGRGQSFGATIAGCWELANGIKCLRLKVEYLLEKGQPAIEVPKAAVEQQQPTGEWRTYYTRVSGVTYPNADGSDRQSLVARCRAGERIRLVREPDNPHDRFAVKVLRWDGKQVGYLPSQGVRTDVPWCVGPGMDAGYRYIVRVAGVSEVEDQVYGMSLQVTFWDGPFAAHPTEDPDLPTIESRSGSAPAKSESRRSSTPQHRASGCFTLLLLFVLTVTAALLFAK